MGAWTWGDARLPAVTLTYRDMDFPEPLATMTCVLPEFLPSTVMPKLSAYAVAI